MTEQYPPPYGHDPRVVAAHRGPDLSVPRRSGKKRLAIFLGLAALILVLFGSCAALVLSATPKVKGDPAPPPPAAVASPTGESPSPAPSSEANKPTSNYFDNGTWLVGEDKEIKPGTYRTPGPDQDSAYPSCVAVIMDGKGNPVNDTSTADGPARITLKAGQTVQSTGCKPWQKVG